MRPVGSIESDVLIGRNGYLFLAGGAHDVRRIASGEKKIAPASFRNFQLNLELRHSWCERNNARFLHLIFPDKQSIVPEEWPLEPPLCAGEQHLSQLGDLVRHVSYPVAVLALHKDQSVSRVDTHATSFGFLLVAANTAALLTGDDQEKHRQALLSGGYQEKTVAGDLGSKLTPPVVEVERVYRMPAGGFWFSNSLQAGNNGIVDLRFNPLAPYSQRVLIFGDSFGRSTAAMLQAWFRECHFFRTPYFHMDIADAIRPDIVVTENAERYLDVCRHDDERPFFFAYPHLTGKPYSPPLDFTQALAAVMSFPRKPYADWLKHASKERDGGSTG